MKVNKKIRINNILPWFLILILVAPLVINIGLSLSDVICDKFGVALTARGLDNNNWLEFWKDYAATAIAFLGIYLVWDSANKDRKTQIYYENAKQYLERVTAEEKILVEITQTFDTGVVYRALSLINSDSINVSKMVFTSARDKIDEAHIKFELLTDLSDDFENHDYSEFDGSFDQKIMMDLCHMFHDMEKRYIDMITYGEDYIDRIGKEIDNIKLINAKEQIALMMNDLIKYEQEHDYNIESFSNLQPQLDTIRIEIDDLKSNKFTTKEMNRMMEPIHKEIENISQNIRPKFIRYCKTYIDLKKNMQLKFAMKV